MDKRELVERAKQGDGAAFATLAGATVARLDAAARLILRDPDAARDAVQETYLRAWRDIRALRDVDRFDAWLHRLLANACRDQLRRARRRPVEVELTPSAHPAAPDEFEARWDRDQLDRAFRRLGPEHRAVVVLHYYLGLPLPEAAPLLGIPLGTAKSRLSRALQQMRAVLDAERRAAEAATEGRFG